MGSDKGNQVLTAGITSEDKSASNLEPSHMMCILHTQCPGGNSPDQAFIKKRLSEANELDCQACETLCYIGFEPSKLDPRFWLRSETNPRSYESLIEEGHHSKLDRADIFMGDGAGNCKAIVKNAL